MLGVDPFSGQSRVFKGSAEPKLSSLEKSKNEMISRRDDESVEFYSEEEQQRNHSFLDFPMGGLILTLFFVVRHSCIIKYTSFLTPRIRLKSAPLK